MTSAVRGDATRMRQVTRDALRPPLDASATMNPAPPSKQDSLLTPPRPSPAASPSPSPRSSAHDWTAAVAVTGPVDSNSNPIHRAGDAGDDPPNAMDLIWDTDEAQAKMFFQQMLNAAGAGRLEELKVLLASDYVMSPVGLRKAPERFLPPVFLNSQVLHRWTRPALEFLAVNCRGGRQSETPLLRASAAGRAVCVKFLLDARASPLVVDQLGRSPLAVAAANGHVAVVREILKVSPQLADPKSSGWVGELAQAALDAACRCGKPTILQEFLRVRTNKPPDTTAPVQVGPTPDSAQDASQAAQEMDLGWRLLASHIPVNTSYKMARDLALQAYDLPQSSVINERDFVDLISRLDDANQVVKLITLHNARLELKALSERKQHKLARSTHSPDIVVSPMRGQTIFPEFKQASPIVTTLLESGQDQQHEDENDHPLTAYPSVVDTAIAVRTLGQVTQELIDDYARNEAFTETAPVWPAIPDEEKLTCTHQSLLIPSLQPPSWATLRGTPQLQAHAAKTGASPNRSTESLHPVRYEVDDQADPLRASLLLAETLVSTVPDVSQPPELASLVGEGQEPSTLTDSKDVGVGLP